MNSFFYNDIQQLKEELKLWVYAYMYILRVPIRIHIILMIRPRPRFLSSLILAYFVGHLDRLTKANPLINKFIQHIPLTTDWFISPLSGLKLFWHKLIGQRINSYSTRISASFAGLKLFKPIGLENEFQFVRNYVRQDYHQKARGFMYKKL